jgi:all-trans-8'-apo-beta-carotenal 15,15'-oxygenase
VTPATAELALDWAPLTRDLSRAHAFEPLRVEGRVPDGLEGTLARVGPGLFAPFGRRYGHLFDCDGAVSAVRLANGKAHGAARVIESRELAREREAGRHLYLGFGTKPPGFPRSFKVKNAANTNLLKWNGRLFALYEPSLPTELSCGDDLKTLGETDLSGVIRGAFSAHWHACPARKAVYNFGLRVFPWGSYLDLYELPDAGPARRLAGLKWPGVVFCHDFIVTEKHAVFFGAPVRMRWLDLIFKRLTIAQGLSWRPEDGTEVLIVPLDRPSEAVRFTAEPFMFFHFANAFERGGEIVADFVRYPDYPSADALVGRIMRQELPGRSGARYARAVIDPRAKTLKVSQLWDRECEFPIVAPSVGAAPHRYCYFSAIASGEYPTAVAKVDAETGRHEEHDFGAGTAASEALFVPKPGSLKEDEGWLLSLVFDARRSASFLAILDARDLSRGPLAKAWFDQPLPLTFHGVWGA